VTTLAVHFHEIALKGKNRRRFERQLRDNLNRAMKPLGAKVRSQEGRILIETDAPVDVARARARDVFGVAAVMQVERMPLDLEKVAARIIEAVKAQKPATFRVSTRRNDKRYPKSSVDVDREVGGMVHDATGVPVSLARPELNAMIYVLEGEMLVSVDKIPGAGGLPVGTGGRVAALLSGGIDSPVAAWRMMKRGCHVDFVHFHSHPLVDRKSIEKAQDLVERLTPWQFTSRLHLVPLAEIQKQIRLKCPDKLRVVLYRRFMVRLTERVSRKYRCRALVTGEAVGQVASQTLQNLAAVDAVATLPILRPLIAMDKQEIVDQAMALGTFETSIEPDQDCCKLFLPPSPAIHASIAECEEAEAALDVDTLVGDALARVERESFAWP
jgi:thiamine biosynthesis protein ThiI